MSRSKCKGIQFFIHFRRTHEFNFKVMLKVLNFVYRFLEKKLLNFCEATKSSGVHSMKKYSQRLLNVPAGETK